MKPTRAALYARCSTGHQDVGLQVDELRAVAAHRGLHLVAEYVDEGVSGATISRPGFAAMMKAAQAGKFEHLLVWKLDRLGRSLPHLLSSLEVLVGRCPFGEHDTASLIVDPKANTWTCSAGCGNGGVVAFVAKAEGVSVTHAIELLKGDFTPEPGTVAKKATRLIGASLLEPDEPDATVLDRVLAYYTRTLLDSPEALTFLHDRGIRDPDVIPTFRLGYCDRTLGYRVPKANRKAGAAIRAQLLRLGVLRESGHEHFRGSIVVPILDEHGAIVNVYGHKLRDDLRAGTPTEVWLNECESGVLNAPGLVEGGKVILAGSVLDTLAWWALGHGNVTTTFGRAALPTAARELLTARKIRSVAVASTRSTASMSSPRAAGASRERVWRSGQFGTRELHPRRRSVGDVVG